MDSCQRCCHDGNCETQNALRNLAAIHGVHIAIVGCRSGEWTRDGRWAVVYGVRANGKEVDEQHWRGPGGV